MPGADVSPVELVHDLLIPMRDGIRLAANLYRPVGGGRCPCLVTYLPYHKDGRGGLWYDTIHRFFAQRGYASLVIDFRGLGCSEGINNIPFDSQEGRDGHDAVEWAAGQPWCDGNLGMWGTSYGGITSLKTAAERPHHLKAIVPINATTDNYLDFLLLGGCRNGFWPNGDWGPRMIAYNLTPPLAPDPDGRLQKLWQERLEQSRPWCLEWYDAPNEAARWAERAIPVERITVATLAVCGWQDFYVQGTLDYFQRIEAPKKLLMGPWKHVFPNLAPVEPVNLLEGMIGWWDHWLKGEANNSSAGPPITLFVQGVGVWRQEEAWPPTRNQKAELYLHPDRTLRDRPCTDDCASESYSYDPTVGLDSLAFDPWTTGVVDSGQHNGDDARSLCYTSDPLPANWEVTGQAQVRLTLRASVTGLNCIAKLCDVDEGGRSRLVTMGWSPDGAAAAGSVQPVTIPLRATSYDFRRGHRLRLSIALADFPRLWPTPQAGSIRLAYDAPHQPLLILPRTPPPASLSLPQFPPLGPPPKSAAEVESTQSWQVGRELVRQKAFLESRGQSRYHLRDGGMVLYTHEYNAAVVQSDPASTNIQVRSDVEVRRASGTVLVQTASSFTPLTVSIRAAVVQNGGAIWTKEWHQKRSMNH